MIVAIITALLHSIFTVVSASLNQGRIPAYTSMFVHTHTCIHTHAHEYTHTHTCIHTHTCAYTHTCMHTHAHVHTHIAGPIPLRA